MSEEQGAKSIEQGAKREEQSGEKKKSIVLEVQNVKGTIKIDNIGGKKDG